jgi:hypothetical protein
MGIRSPPIVVSARQTAHVRAPRSCPKTSHEGSLSACCRVTACHVNRDRGWPCGLPLPHHRTYGSVYGGSADCANACSRRRGGRRGLESCIDEEASIPASPRRWASPSRLARRPEKLPSSLENAPAKPAAGVLGRSGAGGNLRRASISGALAPHRDVIGPRLRAQHGPMMALPARHRERPHAVGAHVAEGHRVAGWRSRSLGHGHFSRLSRTMSAPGERRHTSARKGGGFW